MFIEQLLCAKLWTSAGSHFWEMFASRTSIFIMLKTCSSWNPIFFIYKLQLRQRFWQDIHQPTISSFKNFQTSSFELEVSFANSCSIVWFLQVSTEFLHSSFTIYIWSLSPPPWSWHFFWTRLAWVVRDLLLFPGMVPGPSASSGSGRSGGEPLFPSWEQSRQELQGFLVPGYVTWEEYKEERNWPGVPAGLPSNPSSSTAQPGALT